MSLNRPRILLMGPRRSGKSSIQRVVFQKMSPHETLFLESTGNLSIKFIANNPYVQFEVWDFPGDVDFREGVAFEDQTLSPDLIFGNSAALVYVIDAQDDPASEALGKLHEIVMVARTVNPNMHFEVFIHKVDGDLFLSEDHKLDCQRDIQEQVELELEDAARDSDSEITLSFYLTSIYDHSIFEAFSKVVHKLIPQLPAMENLLNIFIANCEVEKAFLFDVVSKIYIATDYNPVDIQSYELCSDMIDVVIDVSCIYGMKEGEPLTSSGAPVGKAITENGAAADSGLPSAGNQTAAAAASGATDATSQGLASAAEDEEGDGAADGDKVGEHDGYAGGNGGAIGADGHDSFEDELDPGADEGSGGEDRGTDDVNADGMHDPQQKREDLAFDYESASLIRLNNNMVLYLRQVASYLALVCIVRSPNYEKQGIFNHNVECFSKALAKLFYKDAGDFSTTSLV